MKNILLVAMVLLTGCHCPYLQCRTEYLFPLYLSSEQINTPDSQRECFYGQQIIVKWDLPDHCLARPVILQLHIRYGTRELKTFTRPVTTNKGYTFYRLLNQDYWCQGGILSYQAELIQEGLVLDKWTHSLWVEIIQINEDT